MPASGIVWPADGVIVSANHVIKRDENIKVGLGDGQTVSAAVAGRDPTTDLAVLRADATGLSTPTRAKPNTETMRVGHLVLALG